MDALASQSIRRLCERLESFRSHGPIPALMAEYPAGTPDSETQPLNGFERALPSWSLRQLSDTADLNRRTWLAAEPAVVAQFRVFCRDAGTVAIYPLRAAGFHVGLGTNNSEHRWLWAVFELAERQLPQTFLRLDGGDVFRVGAGSALVGERMLSNARGRAGNDPFAALIASVGITRYWKLADAVDASLAALDIANTLGIPQPAAEARTATQSIYRVGRKVRDTRKIDVDGALGKLESKMRKQLVRELGSETAAQAALVDCLYSLSAENLRPLLKTVGCKASAKTISRSPKYDKAWLRYRRPAPPSDTAVDVGPAALSDRPAHSADTADDTLRGWRRDAGLSSVRPSVADVTSDAINSGHLSKRTGGRGTTRIGKTVAEKAADDAADRFAREAGINLPPAE